MAKKFDYSKNSGILTTAKIQNFHVNDILPFTEIQKKSKALKYSQKKIRVLQRKKNIKCIRAD